MKTNRSTVYVMVDTGECNQMLELEAEYTYTPAERAYNGDNGSAPGCDEDFDIIGIFDSEGRNLTPLLYSFSPELVYDIIRQIKEL